MVNIDLALDIYKVINSFNLSDVSSDAYGYYLGLLYQSDDHVLFKYAVYQAINGEFDGGQNGMTERQLKEIAFALLYKKYFNHGTDGHNSRITLADISSGDYSLFVDYNEYDNICFKLYSNLKVVLVIDRVG